jgi:8-oxo-dGTP diphosphatase
MADPMLPANAPVLASLALPSEYAITDAARYGIAKMLLLLERRLERDLKMVQVREPHLSEAQRALFTAQVIELGQRHGCKVLVKAPFPGAHGLHLTAAQLMQLEAKPLNMLVGASCHTRQEVERAMRLDLDFAVLGPVHQTKSHESAAPLGWDQFTDLAKDASLPVYAIGGLGGGDLDAAWTSGAHGIAMITGAWHVPVEPV